MLVSCKSIIIDLNFQFDDENTCSLSNSSHWSSIANPDTRSSVANLVTRQDLRTSPGRMWSFYKLVFGLIIFRGMS